MLLRNVGLRYKGYIFYFRGRQAGQSVTASCSLFVEQARRREGSCARRQGKARGSTHCVCSIVFGVV